MKKIAPVIYITVFFLVNSAISSAQSIGAAFMFRQTPEHMVTNMPEAGIFYQKEWSFFSDAPIRSTPLVINNNIYFGNAEGKFFCVSKIDKKQQWVFKAQNPIHSSPAFKDGLVFFADAGQSLYALDAENGEKIWQFNFGKSRSYEWQFDYFLSSPTISNGKIFIGGADGKLHIIDYKSGKELLLYTADAGIRSTPAVSSDGVFFGDVTGKFYCLDLVGKLKWKFSTLGDTVTQLNFSYDRKAIISSPVVNEDIVIFGSRDGNLYALNSKTGERKWMFDFSRSWVLSSPIIYNNTVIQGTSDGKFVNAIDIATGKEVWRTRTNDVIFSSPTIVGDVVYTGAFDGVMYCMDAKTGKRIVPGFMAGSNILSSAVYDNRNLYFGSDDGNLYALKATERPSHFINSVDSNFVFQKSELPFYSFKTGVDGTLSEVLRRRGFTQCEDDSALAGIMQRTTTDKFKRKIVFASNYFPPLLLDGGKNSLMRRFLDTGGEIVILNLNFAFFRKVTGGFRINNYKSAGEILGIDFVYEDTRALKGAYPTFATAEGLKIGLPRFSNSLASVKKSEIDIAYAINEIGEATSWTKNYNNNGKFTQLWLDEFHNPERTFEVIYKVVEN